MRLRGLLEELHATIESSAALSAALTTTIESTERLGASFSRAPGERRTDGRPFDISEYQATAEATTVAVEELNRLVVSLTEFVASPVWEERDSQLGRATGRAQTTLEELIDRSYRRGLVLIGVLIVGGLVAAFVYRLVSARLMTRRSVLN